MPKKQKRDNAYYEERLKNEFPATYADLQAGKHKTIAEAAIAAGLKKPRTRIQELRNAFGKSSKTEQADFLCWLTAQGYAVASSPAVGVAASAIAMDRRLLPATKARIEEIMAKRGVEMGEVMAEMGCNPYDQSVSRALRRLTRLQPDVITALEKWLAANASI
ncbi:hypothetical protein [Peteryoungia ipomoeae]|uniref:Uncharacterized protein n=1 Tax=Peteryoungia ipomoeae TaxID=1210932 RepID=A0A4S8P3I4_9HYPH|nr:hypothetical protein [Peteryoungia ipomoeae]THV22284.1 hypothetical protein FAA97_13415 [Peteryoungia ipomoeae]